MGEVEQIRMHTPGGGTRALEFVPDAGVEATLRRGVAIAQGLLHDYLDRVLDYQEAQA